MKPNSESPLSETKSDDSDPTWLLGIAIHEAAHAVAAVVHGIDLISVDIKKTKMGDNVREGCAFVEPIEPSDIIGKGRDAAMPHLVLSLAGPMAQDNVYPGYLDDFPDSSDGKRALAIAAAALFDVTRHDDFLDAFDSVELKCQVEVLLASAIDEADRFVDDHLLLIIKVAGLLFERDELTGDEVRSIVNAA
jgi:hypothetical protein